MTIISHTHKFIYLKARKVASSSLLVAFGQHCREPDIVTAPGDSEGFQSVVLNSEYIHTHTPPRDIRNLVTPEQWQSYTKITCVRNPWDVAVSMLFWRIHRRDRKKGIRFSDEVRQSIMEHKIDVKNPEYRKHFLDILAMLHRNCGFYFDSDGTPFADIYLRFENLQHEFDSACNRLNLPQTQLPTLKANAREKGKGYAAFYDDELRDIVRKNASRTIDYFGYTF